MTDPHSQLRKNLVPYHARLFAIVDRAWKMYRSEISPDARLVFDCRARACALWCFMIHQAASEFADDPAGRVIEKNQSAFLLLENGVAVLFKKLDQNGVARNTPTPLQLDLWAQAPVPVIGGSPRLHVGYVVNDLGTAYERIMVSFPAGIGSVAWAYEITSAGDTGSEMEPVSLSSDDDDAKLHPRVGAKRTAAEERGVFQDDASGTDTN